MKSPATLLALILSLASLPAQQIVFDHLNAGAAGTNQNDPLLWANGAVFAASSGFYYAMSYSASGTYAGFFNSSPTLTVLAATTNNLGPVPFAPALGSFIKVQLTLISAPPGGAFAYWTNSLGPTFSLNPGDSTPLVSISDLALGAGSPRADPFGHIHGRRFTTTALGDYVVNLRLFDTSANGAGGAPIHSPSGDFYMDFRAIPEPAALTWFGLGLGVLAWLRLCARRASRR